MLTHYQIGLVESYYDFVGFAQATGLQSPFVGPAYNDFREFTWNLMKKEESYNTDGIITEAFDRWSREQTVYQLN